MPGDERDKVEHPALAQLQVLGWRRVEGEKLSPDARTDVERNSLKGVVLESRLANSIGGLNHWISGENLRSAVRQLTTLRGTDLIDANQKIWALINHGVKVRQHRHGKGSQTQTVHIIDFDNPENNDFLCVDQFKISGVETIFPDIVLFVNGLPLAVIECKSPYKSGDPMKDGIDQLLRYANRRGEEKPEGAEKLFRYNLMMVATHGDKALVGTITSRMEDFSEWKTTYPLALEEGGEEETDQRTLIAGLFSKENFLDILRNFTVFETTGNRVIKKIPRYQQFRAVHKAIKRLTTNSTAVKDKSGVIWHTQGSGKSLTMAFLVNKIRRTPALEDYKLVFLTDRTHLDEQLTSTFERVLDEKVYHANAVSELQKYLEMSTPDLVMGMMQKFQESGEGLDGSVLNESAKIIVLTDEAHRTQYGAFGALMAEALPNASRIAFTGTPIPKTAQVFGELIDTYNIEQSYRDGVTVQLRYEGRKPEVHLLGKDLDILFDKWFKNHTDKEKAAIKKKHGTQKAIYEAPQRIRSVCEDIVEHYREHVRPNGFKAMIVAPSRLAAVIYKEELDKLGESQEVPHSAVVISKAQNDRGRITKHTDPAKHRQHIANFRKPCGTGEGESDLSVLIVNSMLLTGFDAPIAQVIYLDRNLANHSLMQAIARVNRTHIGKNRGYVVDYHGLYNNLMKALAIFSDDDVRGAIIELKDEIPRLERMHTLACLHFQDIGLENTEDCVQFLADDARRQAFRSDFLAFARQLDVVLPDPAATRFLHDMRLLGKIAHGAKNRYRDARLDIVAAGAGEKVRELVDKHLISEGVDPKIDPVDLLAGEFEETLKDLTTARAQASEIEHAIRHHIKIRWDEDPAYYKTLSEQLDEILRQQTKNWEALVKLLQVFREKVRSSPQERAREKGLSPTELAFYNTLAEEVGEKAPKYASKVDAEDKMKQFSRWLVELLEQATQPVNFFNRWDLRDALEVTIEDAVRDQFGNEVAASVTKALMELAKTKFQRKP